MKLIDWIKKPSEKAVPMVPVEVPAKTVKGSAIDPRLVVKTGKRGKTVFMKTPCVVECAGCPKQFTPNPPEDGKTFCSQYPNPAALWTGLNQKGEPKTCPGKWEPKKGTEEKFKVNPLKASKRGAGASKTPTAEVAVATNSKEARKRKKANQKKNQNVERRDSR